MSNRTFLDLLETMFRRQSRSINFYALVILTTLLFFAADSIDPGEFKDMKGDMEDWLNDKYKEVNEVDDGEGGTKLQEDDANITLEWNDDMNDFTIEFDGEAVTKEGYVFQQTYNTNDGVETMLRSDGKLNPESWGALNDAFNEHHGMDVYEPDGEHAVNVKNLRIFLNRIFEKKGFLLGEDSSGYLGPDNVQADGNNFKIYWPNLKLKDGWDKDNGDVNAVLDDLDIDKTIDNVNYDQISEFITMDGGVHTISEAAFEAMSDVILDAAAEGSSYLGVGLGAAGILGLAFFMQSKADNAAGKISAFQTFDENDQEDVLDRLNELLKDDNITLTKDDVTWIPTTFDTTDGNKMVQGEFEIALPDGKDWESMANLKEKEPELFELIDDNNVTAADWDQLMQAWWQTEANLLDWIPGLEDMNFPIWMWFLGFATLGLAISLGFGCMSSSPPPPPRYGGGGMGHHPGPPMGMPMSMGRPPMGPMSMPPPGPGFGPPPRAGGPPPYLNPNAAPIPDRLAPPADTDEEWMASYKGRRLATDSSRNICGGMIALTIHVILYFVIFRIYKRYCGSRKPQAPVNHHELREIVVRCNS